MPVLEQAAAQYKSIKTPVSIDEAEGIVEAFVSGVGNKDSVGDIVAPGAFNASLKRRLPRVVWGHDWNHPIGKVLEIYEVSPGDYRLPSKMKAAGIGGLYAKVQFNLKSEKGREAFAMVSFFGADQEWSIGYKTLDAIYDNTKSANVLKELELYEVSPVLHGANNLTATISIKSADQGDFTTGEAKEEDSNDDDSIRKGLVMLKAFQDENPGWEPELPEGIKRDFSASERREAADSGAAMPDGSFPIKNASDLRNAIQAVGRAKNIDAAKAHIKKRARALGLTNLLPDDWKSIDIDQEVKIDVPGAEGGAPIGALTGGRGPRRGNLEDLLDYWRPIMKKPGGFRRCLVILADHPELGPLPNLCAWLHHETTGKWPNEGHHHGKSEEVHGVGSIESVLGKALSEHFATPVLVREVQDDSVVFDLYGDEGGETYMVGFKSEEDDFLFGRKQRVHAETTYRPYDDPDDHMPKKHSCKEGEPCECGGVCSTEKTEVVYNIFTKPGVTPEQMAKSIQDALEVKAGRVLSSSNMAKLQQAQGLLNEVVASAIREEQTPGRVIISGAPGVKDALEAIADVHGGYVEAIGSSFAAEVKSEKHLAALRKAVSALEADFINS